MSGSDALGPRGSALWAALNQASATDVSGVVALEACRAADRLDLLEERISGGDLTLLQEARLQQAALKSLLESAVLKVSERGRVDPVDDLARARAARRAEAQGSYGS